MALTLEGAAQGRLMAQEEAGAKATGLEVQGAKHRAGPAGQRPGPGHTAIPKGVHAQVQLFQVLWETRPPQRSGVCHPDLGASQCSPTAPPSRDGLDVDTQMLLFHTSYLQGGLPQEARSKLAQAIRAQVVRGQVEEVRPGRRCLGWPAAQQHTHPPAGSPARRSSRSAECSFRARSSGVSWAWHSAREQALNVGAEPWCSTACSTCWCSPGEGRGVTRTGSTCPALGVGCGQSGGTLPLTPA